MSARKQRRAALVTGASYGVGAATALALAQEGCNVAISATQVDHLTATLAKIAGTGMRALPLALDLREPEGIERAMAEAALQLGGIDVLVNTAASFLRKPALEMTPAEWDEAMAINLRGAFFMAQQLARHLVARGAGGAIVNIASTHGLIGAAERSVYGISKGALIQMTRMLAIEWARYGIRVNAVAPGRMETASPARTERTADPQYLRRCARASLSTGSPPSRRSLPRYAFSPASGPDPSRDRSSCSTAG
jgi:NAD(P)-dependent dehydrogenase (short-subunit alcohol dehydrogenase family)